MILETVFRVKFYSFLRGKLCQKTLTRYFRLFQMSLGVPWVYSLYSRSSNGSDTSFLTEQEGNPESVKKVNNF